MQKRPYEFDDNVHVAVTFELDLDLTVIDRQVYSILDWLGDIGGLAEALVYVPELGHHVGDPEQGQGEGIGSEGQTDGDQQGCDDREHDSPDGGKTTHGSDSDSMRIAAAARSNAPSGTERGRKLHPQGVIGAMSARATDSASSSHIAHLSCGV